MCFWSIWVHSIWICSRVVIERQHDSLTLRPSGWVLITEHRSKLFHLHHHSRQWVTSAIKYLPIFFSPFFLLTIRIISVSYSICREIVVCSCFSLLSLIIQRSHRQFICIFCISFECSKVLRMEIIAFHTIELICIIRLLLEHTNFWLSFAVTRCPLHVTYTSTLYKLPSSSSPNSPCEEVSLASGNTHTHTHNAKRVWKVTQLPSHAKKNNCIITGWRFRSDSIHQFTRSMFFFFSSLLGIIYMLLIELKQCNKGMLYVHELAISNWRFPRRPDRRAMTLFSLFRVIENILIPFIAKLNNLIALIWLWATRSSIWWLSLSITSNFLSVTLNYRSANRICMHTLCENRRGRVFIGHQIAHWRP